MLIVIALVVLALLWFLGYISLPIFPISNIVLFTLFGISITLYQVLVLRRLIFDLRFSKICATME